MLFAALIALITAARFVRGLNTVLSFWLAYILTRPLGASIGDYLSADTSEGGCGLGTLGTSWLFLAVSLALIAYLSLRKVDVILTDPALDNDSTDRPHGARPAVNDTVQGSRTRITGCLSLSPTRCQQTSIRGLAAPTVNDWGRVLCSVVA